MPDKEKVIRFKKKKNLNIGVIIFFIITIYIGINIYLYMTKPHLSIYEVPEMSLAHDTLVKGIIVRDEIMLTTEKAGYINYYIREGARVAKNDTIYSVDDSKNTYETLMADRSSPILMDEDVRKVKKEILTFRKSFDGDNYNDVYRFKADIVSTVKRLADINLKNNMQDIIDTTGQSSTTSLVKTNQSGIISFHTDTYDGLKADAITSSVFADENYTEKDLRKNELTEQSSPAYKIITSDNWSITAMITKSIFESLVEKKNIKFTLLEDDFTISAPFSTYNIGEDYFIKIELNKYMIRYLEERFLELELLVSNERGLKIPKTSIVEKEFYMIPLSYFTYGGDSKERGVIKKAFNKDTGEAEYQFVQTDIYYEDDMYGYVDFRLFNYGDLLYIEEKAENFQVSMVGKLEGVYNINKGYAVFRRIERISENEDYLIVKKDTQNGIALYDHIAYDASTAVEAAVIY